MGILAFFATLMTNPVFVGVGGGAIVGGLMVALRSIPAKLWRSFLHIFTLEVHVENDDEAFYHIDKYLATHEGAKKARTLRLTSARKRPSYEQQEESSWNLGPGIGSVWFWHGWRFVIVSRSLTEAKNGNGTREYITIRILGRSREPLLAFLKQAEASKENTKTKIYTYTGGYWSVLARVTPRKAETVILPHEQKDRILKDIQWFIDNQDFYVSRGIPYHRGYLFEGSPGCGKSSMIPVVAAATKKDICTLSLSTLKDDKELLEAVCEADDNAIIALEDVDAATTAAQDRDADNDTEAKGVTLAGLLNVLDGMVTPDGRIFIMTTNYPERLDAALIRPGRIDVRERFGLLDTKLQEEMSLLFYNTPVSREEPISPASLQGIFMKHKTADAAQRELNNER